MSDIQASRLRAALFCVILGLFCAVIAGLAERSNERRLFAFFAFVYGGLAAWAVSLAVSP